MHNDVEPIESPTGWIPRYEDLRPLFQKCLQKEYAKEDYVKQFSTSIPENLAKIDRVEKFYRDNVADAPGALFAVLSQQKERLLKTQKRFGDYISPECFANNTAV